MLGNFGDTAKRSATYADLGGDVSASEVYGDAVGDLASIIEDAQALMREMKQLQSHEHEWDDQSYCTLCGADGRA